MRIGLLSDVHGNLPALEAVLEACSIRCDALWCLGDTVGYGASPNECVRARPRPLRAGAGGQPRPRRDRPRRLRDLLERRGPCDPLDARGARGRRRDVARHGLEPTAQRGPIGLFHALAPRSGVGVRRRRRRGHATRCRSTTNELVLVGHTHVPLAARLVDDRLIGGQAGAELDLRPPRRAPHAAQPGLGRSAARRRRPRRVAAAYLDDDGRPERAIFQRVRYDIAAAQRAIEAAGLPQHLADRLSFGM